MGQVIAFRLQAQPKRRPPPDGPARILFFTGVRYQRDDADLVASDCEPTTPESRRGGRKAGGHRRRRRD
jgi:hypothetical protein